MSSFDSPRERLNYFVTKYNEAYNSGDFSTARHYANSIVDEVDNELKKPDISPSWRNRCAEIKKGVVEFINSPDPSSSPKAAAGSGGKTGNDSVAKIKSTDWFAAPIPDLTMDDIAGLSKLRDAFVLNIFAITSPQYSDIYRKYRGEENGIQVLLYGPPGTGKTHSVKCLAGSMKCKIAVVQIKDVMANLVGDGAKIIAEIFEQASQYDKSIIFFDEIDAIASSREGDDSRHTKEQLTTLLTYMDGFTSKAKPGQLRIVIAATNRPWALDSAVKRGGRFDTQIYVPLPDPPARKKLIEMALGIGSTKKNAAKPPLASDVTIDWLIEQTEGYAGADIKSICRQAVGYPMKREILARAAGRNENHCVERRDFETVINQYINSTTDEDLMRFDAYGMNMEFGAEYLKAKFSRIIAALYNNYVYSLVSEQERRERRIEKIDLEHFELNFIKKIYSNGVEFYNRLEQKYKANAGFLEYIKKVLG